MNGHASSLEVVVAHPLARLARRVRAASVSRASSGSRRAQSSDAGQTSIHDGSSCFCARDCALHVKSAICKEHSSSALIAQSMGGRQILWRSIFQASKNAMASKSPEGCFGIVGFHCQHATKSLELIDVPQQASTNQPV